MLEVWHILSKLNCLTKAYSPIYTVLRVMDSMGLKIWPTLKLKWEPALLNGSMHTSEAGTALKSTHTSGTRLTRCATLMGKK